MVPHPGKRQGARRTAVLSTRPKLQPQGKERALRELQVAAMPTTRCRRFLPCAFKTEELTFAVTQEAHPKLSTLRDLAGMTIRALQAISCPLRCATCTSTAHFNTGIP